MNRSASHDTLLGLRRLGRRCYDRLRRVRLVGRVDRLWKDEAEAAVRADYWVGRVQSIRRFTSKNKDARAPYKPLLLLWLIGRLAAGHPAEVSFKESELDLKLLMYRYRLGRSIRVGVPFVYLGSNPELWRVEDSGGNDVSKMPQ